MDRPVAERSAYYALPEGSRGIFVGGGGSVRALEVEAHRHDVALVVGTPITGAEPRAGGGMTIVTPHERIDADLAHRLFIRHALVLREWDADLPFVTQNCEVLDDVKAIAERITAWLAAPG